MLCDFRVKFFNRVMSELITWDNIRCKWQTFAYQPLTEHTDETRTDDKNKCVCQTREFLHGTVMIYLYNVNYANSNQDYKMSCHLIILEKQPKIESLKSQDSNHFFRNVLGVNNFDCYFQLNWINQSSSTLAIRTFDLCGFFLT